VAVKKKDQTCHHCMFSRMANDAKLKIEAMEKDGTPNGVIAPVRNIEREFRAMLEDQGVCTCGQPVPTKWTRNVVRATGGKSEQ
jgi:hypothetical protein